MRWNLLIFFFFCSPVTDEQANWIKKIWSGWKKSPFLFWWGKDFVSYKYVVFQWKANGRWMRRRYSLLMSMVPHRWGLPRSVNWPVAWPSSEAGGWCGFGCKPKHNRGRWFASAHIEFLDRYHLVFASKYSHLQVQLALVKGWSKNAL